MTDKMADISAQCNAERDAGAVTCDQVRDFLHPRQDVCPPTLYRSPDELAEYAAVRAEAREQLPD